eukprot:CAMPEP_0182420254 /NCGR_PEP_ID=MMETSP1167-20130531/4916_1 /TAXON_ID=2988 /ORGANISM="Mallomonas Sp, Strain CCMP3275" /LENGTH=388 /DNA_ID=CAMNT_0024595967 /DNA_START=89 /DNA_END=1258 /DNA_ORIENTATION=+
MGSGSSVEMRGTKEEIFQRLLPAYYIDAEITEQDVINATKSWDYVTNDTSPEYLARAGEEGFPSSCLTWFYDSFFELSSELDEKSKELYKDNLKVQVRALVGMIKLILKIFKDPSTTDVILTKVANGHTKKGVKAYQYGVVGEVLIGTFQFCLGDAFTEELKQSWIRIFSHCLKVIVPVAISNDQIEDGVKAPTMEEADKNRDEQTKRLSSLMEKSNRQKISLASPVFSPKSPGNEGKKFESLLEQRCSPLQTRTSISGSAPSPRQSRKSYEKRPLTPISSPNVKKNLGSIEMKIPIVEEGMKLEERPDGEKEVLETETETKTDPSLEDTSTEAVNTEEMGKSSPSPRVEQPPPTLPVVDVPDPVDQPSKSPRPAETDVSAPPALTAG